MSGPISFTKEHPVGVLVSMGVGMMIGPWILGNVSRFTGVTISLPTFAARNGG